MHILLCNVIAIYIYSGSREVPFVKDHKPGTKAILEDINPKPKCQQVFFLWAMREKAQFHVPVGYRWLFLNLSQHFPFPHISTAMVPTFYRPTPIH